MNIRRIQQVLKYGKIHAKEIAALNTVSKGWFSIFLDVLYAYNKYGMWSNQYKKEKFWELRDDQKVEIGRLYKAENDFRNKWVKEFFENYRFIIKWSDIKYESSASMQNKRRLAYAKYFNIPQDCFIGYGVVLHKHHYTDSYISVGKKGLIAEECNIDYTGGFTMRNHVAISEGVKILTHNHELDYDEGDLKKGLVLTPLEICDEVWIGTKALIMPGVSQIGRGAIVSAGSVVTKKVPPYAVVQGNPAKIVGFRFTPEEALSFEKKNIEEESRFTFEELDNIFKKYFADHIKEIKVYTSLICK